jgi:hypothetical protein
MWRIYLIEFIIALMISILWVHIIDKHNKEK